MNSAYQYEGPAAVHRRHAEESASFLVGLLNGFGLSAILTAMAYLTVKAAFGA